jgi:hypothetical protein
MTPKERAQWAVREGRAVKKADPENVNEFGAIEIFAASAIKAAVNETYETCARLADEFDCDGRKLDLVDLAADIAAAIRARGKASAVVPPTPASTDRATGV